MIELTGNVQLGNIGGGPSSLRLSDLADVSIVSPQTGQYLRYNGTIQEWQNSFLNADVFSYLSTALVAGSNITITPGVSTFLFDVPISITGDATGSATSGVLPLTLSTVNATVGTFGSATQVPQITVDAKGRITNVTNVAITGGGGGGNASNLLGGVTGSLPYQSATDTTTFLAPGLSTQVLTGGLSGPSWSNAPFISGTNFTNIPNSGLVNSSITIGSTSVSLGGTITSITGLTSVTATTFNGNITGTASSLTTARNISASGDASWTVLFDGSADVSSTLTLATVNPSPQIDAFRRITVNDKGLVTSTSAVSSGNIIGALGFTPVNIAGDTMTGPLILDADPVAALGAATKQYVDTVAAGLNVHASCITATTAALPASTYNNGISGVGATLTANANGDIGTVGGYASLALNDRVLVKDQGNQIENGIYVVTDLGSVSTPWILTRSSDMDGSPSSELRSGDYTFIEDGTIANTQWAVTTPNPIVVGTSLIAFTQISGAASYAAGVGIDITGLTISNIGVLSNIAGTGIGVSGPTGNVTITNTGVTSLTAGTNIGLSGSTGNVTVSVTGTVASATHADNLNGGATGSLPYQSGANTTTFLAAGTTSEVLVGGPTAPSWSNTPTLTGTNFTGIPNTGLVNSSLTIGSTNISLGGTATTLAGLTSVTSTTFVGNLTGNASTATSATSATNATNVGITDDTTTNATKYITWVDVTSGNNPEKVSSTKLTFNPSTGVLTATSFSGTFIGNASTATALQTARTIAISGGVTGTATSFDGTANIIIPVTSVDASTLGTGTVPVARLSGTYNISISGNAATATALQTARTINGVSFDGTGNITVTANTGNAITFNNGGAGAVSGTTFNGSAAQTISYNTIGAPSTTGTGASGSWGISITGSSASTTGNAATATTLQTARTIALSGAATGTATSFNGSANITIPVTALNASNLSAGTVPDAVISGAYTGVTNLTMSGVLQVDSGMNGGYGSTTGSGTAWGGNIYGMGPSFDGSGTGTSYVTTSQYGISWLRGTHVSANANIGEGLYVFTNGGLRGGIGTTGIYTTGAVFADGDVTAFSDRRLKTDILVIENALEKVSKISGITYRRVDKDDTTRHAGVIAQEVEEVLPEVVTETDNGMKAVAYGNMVGLLIEAIKELKNEVFGLKQELAILKGNQ